MADWAQDSPGLFGSSGTSGGGKSFGDYAGNLGGGISSLIAMLMGGSMKNPANSAMGYFGQAGNMLPGFYNPYINAGQQAMGQLGGNYNEMLKNLPALQSQYSGLMGLGGGLAQQYQQMAQNPAENMNKIGSTYQQSPGYNWQVGQGMNAANNAAAAGGMLGSPQHQQQAAQMTQGIANQDYYNYLGNALGQQQQGLAGEAGLYGQGLAGAQGLFSGGLSGLQGLMSQGYGASNELAQSLGALLQGQGMMGFAGQAYQNLQKQQQAGFGGDAISNLIKFAPFLMG